MSACAKLARRITSNSFYFTCVSTAQVPTYGRRGSQSSAERGLRLSLQRIEDLTAAAGQHRAPHRHPFHCEVIWIEAGNSHIYIDGRVYALQPGDLYALPAGVIHSCGANNSLRGWMLHCSPEMLAEKPREVITRTWRGNLWQDRARLAHQQRWWDSFAYEYRQLRQGRASAIRHQLRLLGVQLHRLSPKPEANARPRPVSLAFRELLDAQYASTRNPVDYATQLGITPAQLIARVREETGAPPRAHIDRRVVLEAERLLAFSSMQIAAVAQMLGFEDANYFWTYFRKHTGRTPGEWREQLRQDFYNAGAPGLELPFGQ